SLFRATVWLVPDRRRRPNHGSIRPGSYPCVRESGTRPGRIRVELWFRSAEAVLLPTIKGWFSWRFEGVEHIPQEGPTLVAANHISYFDPLAHAYLLLKGHRKARFLAKRSEEHTSELQSPYDLVCRLLLEKKK